MRSRRLRARKWHLGLIPVSVAALLGICCVGLRLQDLERSVDHRGAALARQLAAVAVTVEPGSLAHLAQAVADQITVRSVLIVADDGRILARAGALKTAPAAPGAISQPAPGSNGLLFQARLAQPPESGEGGAREPTSNPLPVFENALYLTGISPQFDTK